MNRYHETNHHSMDLSNVYASKSFNKLGPDAQLILKTTLDDLNAKGFFNPSDLASIFLLIDNYTLYYQMKDVCDTRPIVYIDSKGAQVDQIVGEMQKVMKTINQLWRELGGSTKARRTIGKKELAAGEITETERLEALDSDEDDW